MVRKLLVVSLVLASGLGLFWLLGSERNRVLHVPELERESAGSTAEDLGVVQLPAERGDRRGATIEERITQSETTGIDGLEHSSAEPLELHEVWLRVVNEGGAPIESARAMVQALRCDADPEIWIPYPTQPAVGTSRDDGRLGLSPVASVFGYGRTVAIDLVVRHPNYVAYRNSHLALTGGELTVVLQAAQSLVVSGWIDRPSNVAQELEFELEHEPNRQRISWARLGEGRWSCSGLTPSHHVLVVTHESEDGISYSSEPFSFELGAVGQMEIALQLFPHAPLAGVLDSMVPRPVTGGQVLLYVRSGELTSKAALSHQRFTADIEADGTFEFASVPRGGQGFLFAICDGWATVQVPAESLEGTDAMPYLDRAETDSEFGRRDRVKRQFGSGRWLLQPPRTSLPPVVSPLVLAMERTSTFECLVLDIGGNPVAGGSVFLAPQIQIYGIGTAKFPTRSWWGMTDATGLARIENVPPSQELPLSLTLAGYDVQDLGIERAALAARDESVFSDPFSSPGSNGAIRLRAGETVRILPVVVPSANALPTHLSEY